MTPHGGSGKSLRELWSIRYRVDFGSAGFPLILLDGGFA